MKLDQVFQSLLLTGAVVVFISTPAKGEEVRKDIQGKSSTATVGKFTLGNLVAVTGQEFALTKSSVLTPSSIKNRLKEGKILNSLRGSKFDEASKNISQLSEVQFPATSAGMLVQAPTPTNPTNVPPVEGGNQGGIVPITGVKANPTDKGVEIILQTTQGQQLQVTNRSAGNNFIADISGGQLRLPSGEAFTFRSEKPLAGVTEITVTNVDANTVRVTVVGETSQPTVELFDDDTGLVFGVAGAATATQPQPEAPFATEKPATEAPQEEPAARQDDPIELVVTGEQDGYRAPNASTATRTDTPLRDIPQSIQVVPRQVLEDRNVKTVSEAVETVSGVVETSSTFGGSSPIGNRRSIRGFEEDSFSSSLRDGFREQVFPNFSLIGTTEQVEVLKGPASVLFGALEPGGVINLITRQPLAEPYYKVGFEVGSFGRYQPNIDFSGPLNTDKSVLYRFIAAYQSGGEFQNVAKSQTTSIAPSLTFKLGERTNLNLYYEYGRYHADPIVYQVPLLSDGRLPPRGFYANYFPSLNSENHRLGYTLNHELNKDWQIRNNLAINFNTYFLRETYYSNLLDDRFLTGFELGVQNLTTSNYIGQIDLVGKFKTGSISHQLIAGFDFNRLVFYRGSAFSSSNLPDLDIFNPNYDVPRPEFPTAPFTTLTTNQSYGIYLQDQIAFSDNLKMLIGGRYDWLSNESGLIDSDKTVQNDGAFSPRIGLVYQPSKNISFYTSYSQSFRPSIGRNPDNRTFLPTRGTQYEVGVKADFLDGKLSTTLAAYNLTKTNVLTPDPDPNLAIQGFQLQVGEQRSRGIELDVTGEISPGWRMIASYALTDAQVTADNSIPSQVGNLLGNVPQNQASLWTTYTIQDGDLQGLGFGLGLFYIGERQADLANSFQLKDYLRTDAAIYYRRGGLNTAINVRNLFNIDYVRNAPFGTLYVNRGEPLTITGSVSWEF
ncbi:ferrichrome-iron receptor [Calothrix sp. PCC 7716]|nr:ferrichrome-iron receptor [Calothrix sp. PCC 7716]